jgi:geranylgeranylglycerol-phosphate geranylgeranyltransferase
VRVRSRLRTFAVLVRCHNCALAAASVLVGCFLASRAIRLDAILGASAACFIAAGGYALNDVYDITADRANRPWRPLASRRATRRAALCLVAVCWAAGLSLALPAGPAVGAAGGAWVVLLWLYSAGLKGAGAAGHLVISAVAASGFAVGAAAGGDIAAGLPPFAVAFVFHLARELVKSGADIAGDRRSGVRTLAVRLGLGRTAPISALAIAAAMMLSIVPYSAGVYGALYLAPVLGMQPLLMLCIYYLMTPAADGQVTPAACGRVAGILKAVMPFGLAAFMLGGI